MQPTIRIIFWLIAILSLVVAALWYYNEPSFEPLLALLGALPAILDLLALKLLQRAACMAGSSPIPRDLLLATLELPDETEDDDEEEAWLLSEDALNRLTWAYYNKKAMAHCFCTAYSPSSYANEQTTAPHKPPSNASS